MKACQLWQLSRGRLLEMNKIIRFLRQKKHSLQGASLVEYALLVILIAVVSLLAVQLLGRYELYNYTRVASATSGL